MSGLYAFFRSDKDPRWRVRRDGLHKFFERSCIQQEPDRRGTDPVAPSTPPDVIMAISSDSEEQEDPPCKLRRTLPSPTQAQMEHQVNPGFRVGFFSLPTLSLSKATETEHAAETMARSCFEQGSVTWMQVEAIMNALPDEAKRRWKQEDHLGIAVPKSFMTGAWARGPHFGLAKNVKQFPHVSRLLAHILLSVDASFCFSSCTLARNICSKPHRDSFNAVNSQNLVVPCSTFTGGELWIQGEEGRTFLSTDGEPGTMWDACTPVRFDPRRKHTTAPWGGDRIMLIGYHVRHVNKLAPKDGEILCELGFKPDANLD